MNCNYKVKIKDIQNKYQFKIFCKTYDDTEIQEDIDTLEDDVETLQKENAYLNNLAEQAFDKKEVEGEELSINDTIEAKMNVSLYGNTKQETTTGKNLLPNDVETKTENGITITKNDDGTYTINGTATANLSTAINNDFIPMSGTWRMLGCPSGGSSSTYMLSAYVGYWGGDSPNIDTGNGTNITYTGNVKVRLFIKSGTVCNNLIFKPMLTTDTSATIDDFEPYTGGIASPNPDYPQEIQRVTGNNKVVVSNKNLLDWVMPYYNNTQSTNTVYLTNIPKIEVGQKYYFYGTCSDGTLINSSNCACVWANGNTQILNKNPRVTFTAIDISEANRFYVYFTKALAGKTIDTFMLIKGTYDANNLPSYVPHKEQVYELDLGNIELCKIGDYQDYFYKNNNKWYKREVISSVRLDGLNWTAEKISNDIYRMISTKSIFKGENEVSKISELFCNIYKKGSANTTYQKRTGINLYKNLIYVYDSNYNTSTSVDSFKTMLKEKNAILYGILPEPRDIEITDTTLISQLEALKTAMSYAEQTNISQINDDIPFILKVTALTSYNSRIVALEQAILNANRNVPVKNTRKSNEVIEEPKEEVVDDNKDENIIKEEK